VTASDSRPAIARRSELLDDLTGPGIESAPGDPSAGPDRRSWLRRCADAVRAEPVQAVDLTALLEDGQEVAGALRMVRYWPGEPRGGTEDDVGGPAISAAQALLDVVRAVGDPAGAQAWLSDAMARWRRACVLPAGSPPTLAECPAAGARVQPVMRLLSALAEDPSAGYAQLVLLALAGALRPAFPQVHVAVVFGGGEEGTHAKLTLSAQPGGPAGLYPDPRRMAFLASDREFAASLGEAWATSPLAIRDRCVVWEIVDDGRPCHDIIGGSLAAAFGVGLDELARSTRRLAVLRVRRLDPRCAITGRLDRNGALQPVGDYEPKFRAARRQRWRMVVPKNDTEATKHPDIPVRVEYAADLRAAVRHSRRLRPRSHVITAIVLVLVLVLAASLAAALGARAQAHRNALRESAARVANEATQVANGDEPTGLLLAMASDQIAAAGGERTRVFPALEENASTLVKIVRPLQGSYEDSVVSADGSLALIRTTGGTIDLISTANGARLWTRTYEPGLFIAPGQIYIEAMAISDTDQAAAYRSTDGRIHLLRYSTTFGWRETGSVKDPWPARPGHFGDLNSLGPISFSPDGRRLVASDDTAVASYDVADFTKATQVCAKIAAGITVAEQSSVLVGHQNQVSALPVHSCSAAPVMSLPRGTAIDGLYQPATGGVQAVGTNGSKVILYQHGHHPVTVLKLQGISDVQVTPISNGGLGVTAANSQGTFGYTVDPREFNFGFKISGNAASAGGTVIFVHDGIAEVHVTGAGSIGQVNDFYDPAISKVAWTASGDLVAGRLNGAEVFPHPLARDLLAADGGVRELPDSSGSTYSLAASATGPLAAAVIGIDARSPGNPTRVMSWDTASDRSMPVPAFQGSRANVVTFVGPYLLVGYRGGVVREFALHRDAWIQRSELTMAGSPFTMSGTRSGVLYAVTGNAQNGPPTLVELRIGQAGWLRPARSRKLTGPSISVSQALSGNDVVISVGSGVTMKFNSSLRQIGPTARVDVGTVTGIATVPDEDQIVVVGVQQYAVIRESTMQQLGSGSWQRAGDILSATADPKGPYFATYDFFKGTLTVWSVAPRTLRQEACAAIGGNLSRAQWRQYVETAVPYELVCPRNVSPEQVITSAGYGADTYGATVAAAAQALGEPVRLSVGPVAACQTGTSLAAPATRFVVVRGDVVAAMTRSPDVMSPSGVRVGDSLRYLRAHEPSLRASRESGLPGALELTAGGGADQLAFFLSRSTQRITAISSGSRAYLGQQGKTCTRTAAVSG
jgi:hypothetical protein